MQRKLHCSILYEFSLGLRSSSWASKAVDHDDRQLDVDAHHASRPLPPFALSVRIFLASTRARSPDTRLEAKGDDPCDAFRSLRRRSDVRIRLRLVQDLQHPARVRGDTRPAPPCRTLCLCSSCFYYAHIYLRCTGSLVVIGVRRVVLAGVSRDGVVHLQ